MPINKQAKLAANIFNAELELAPTRQGFGKGLLAAAKKNNQIVGLCADLVESTQMHFFAEEFPERFIEVGVAEQNLVTVASGLAAEGKIPFTSSYAVFSPGRNWEQIRTTICYNDQNVKIIGSHAGLSVGPDGATHQALEDVAIMRALPNMQVIVPADRNEAYQATLAIAADGAPTYLRLAREKSAVFTTPQTPFKIGQAVVYFKGSDVTVVACGPLLYEALKAAHQLEGEISVEVINAHTIKPLDRETIIQSVQKTGCIVSVEEHQVTGGLGGAIAELLAQEYPTPLKIIGMPDRFGESGTALELWDHFHLSAKHLVQQIREFVNKYK